MPKTLKHIKSGIRSGLNAFAGLQTTPGQPSSFRHRHAATRRNEWEEVGKHLGESMSTVRSEEKYQKALTGYDAHNPTSNNERRPRKGTK